MNSDTVTKSEWPKKGDFCDHKEGLLLQSSMKTFFILNTQSRLFFNSQCQSLFINILLILYTCFSYSIFHLHSGLLRITGAFCSLTLGARPFDFTHCALRLPRLFVKGQMMIEILVTNYLCFSLLLVNTQQRGFCHLSESGVRTVLRALRTELRTLLGFPLFFRLFRLDFGRILIRIRLRNRFIHLGVCFSLYLVNIVISYKISQCANVASCWASFVQHFNTTKFYIFYRLFVLFYNMAQVGTKSPSALVSRHTCGWMLSRNKPHTLTKL